MKLTLLSLHTTGTAIWVTLDDLFSAGLASPALAHTDKTKP